MSVKKFEELFDELKNVRTIELVCAQKLVIEKVFWAILGIAGVAWAFYFVPSNLEVWRTNPSIITRGEIELSEIKYPAQGAGTQVDLPTKVSINGTCIFLCQMTWGSMFTKVILLRMDRAC